MSTIYQTKAEALATEQRIRDIATANEQRIRDIATSGYLGIATTTTTPPATGAYWYRVDTAGTYTNFKGSGNVAIVVTATDLDVVNGVANNRVILEVNNNVATKIVERMKGDVGVDGKTTETWTAKDYVKGSTVYYNGDIWENILNATATDEPNEGSLIWAQRIKTINNVTTVENGFFITDEKRNIAFKVDENGETSFIQKEENVRLNLEPLGLGAAFANVGNVGEFYFCDPNGYVGVKITANGKFESAELGNVTASHVADIARSILSTNGRELSDYNHIITYGQSLSVGQTEKVISTTQPNPNLLNFDGVTRTSAYDKSPTGDTYPINRRISLQPLVERTNDGTAAGVCRETPSTGTGEMFAKSYEETMFAKMSKKVIVSAPGWGGTTIAQLSKGGEYYQQLIDDVTAGKNLTAGSSYRVLAVTWTQGESDYIEGTDTLTYKAKLKQLITDINNDVKAITGQAEDVVLVCYQLSTAMNANRTYPNIALALYEASKEDSRIYVATPMYHMNYNDGWHLNSASSKLLGAYYGDVINRIVMKGEAWQPLHIKAKSVVGSDIYLAYH